MTAAIPIACGSRWRCWTRHPEVGIVGGYYVLVDERRGERYVRMPPTDHPSLFAAMARYVPIAHTVATFRRQAWVEAGGYPLVDNLIDLRFYLRVAKLGWHFANVPEMRGRALRARHELVPPRRSSTPSVSGIWRGCRRRACGSSGCPGGCTSTRSGGTRTPTSRPG